jgi:hypothetical protein
MARWLTGYIAVHALRLAAARGATIEVDDTLMTAYEFSGTGHRCINFAKLRL